MTSATRRPDGNPDANRFLTLGRSLEAEHRLLDAIDAYTQANEIVRDPAIEQRLLRLRFDAFAQVEPPVPREPWPHVPVGSPWPDTAFPVVAPGELTAESLSTGVQHHGCVFVRGLVPVETCERLRGEIELVLAAQDRHLTKENDGEPRGGSFKPFACTRGSPAEQSVWVGVTRRFLWMGEAAMAFDSPAVSFELLGALDASGASRVITEYLGERPCMALDKFTIRRAGLRHTGGEWHQDGSTLNPGVRTMGVWLALTDCGTDAPGLDVVPRRLDGIMPMGTEGTPFQWSVSEDLVQARFAGETIRPVFSPGDALIFDELFLHRTTVDPTMTNVRYAAETWYFAPSACPRDRVLAMF
jgi:Phytanoyl-CoA dioxygenase (PhyH)